jgi:hypothetical protein
VKQATGFGGRMGEGGGQMVLQRGESVRIHQAGSAERMAGILNVFTPPLPARHHRATFLMTDPNLAAPEKSA